MHSSFELRGLRCFAPAAEGEPWTFLPRAADLQRDADGRPLINLIELGASAYLLFTASWGARAEDIEALRNEIALRTQERDAAPVRLAMARVAATTCNVLVGDGRGTFRVVATSPTSGMPPWHALFNLHLRGERLAQARCGLRGERGFLGVEYLAELRTPAAARATLRARPEALAAWLCAHPAAPSDHMRLLEEAIAARVATLTVEAPDPYASALAAELSDRVLARAAELLPGLLRQDAPGDLEVTATLERDAAVPMRAFTDVGALVPSEPQGSLIGGHHAAD